MADTETVAVDKAAQEDAGQTAPVREMYWEELAAEQKIEKLASVVEWYQWRMEEMEAQIRELSLPHFHHGDKMVREIPKHGRGGDAVVGARRWSVLNRNPEGGRLGGLR